jgi:hypothetical protein
MDDRLEIKERQSPELPRELMWLVVQLPYGKAAEVCQKVGHLEISDATVWDMAQRIATTGQVSGLEPVTTQKTGSSDKMAIAMDGCMVNLREEGWKETKIAAVFEIAPQEEQSEVKCVNASYVTHLTVGTLSRMGRSAQTLVI